VRSGVVRTLWVSLIRYQTVTLIMKD
jgi:hypothetical protein